MRVFHDMVFTVEVFLISIEFSSQFECLPNGAPIPNFAHGEPSSPAPDTKRSPRRYHSLTSSTSHDEHSFRLRSRSPQVMNETSHTKLPLSNVLGYGLDQLECIRLSPYRNPQRHFVLRKFTFPADETIKVVAGPHKFRPVPTQEQIVLSTFDGNVFAILEGADTLVGIYKYNPSVSSKVRVKLNMKNGEVTLLTAEETKETPVGRNRHILFGYIIEHMNNNQGDEHSSPRSLDPAKRRLISRASSSSRHVALPTRLFSSDGFGYELDQLKFIRLIPKNNRNQKFELRKFTFPADKLILLHHGSNRYEPIPIEELIVLTTDSGDVFAILESSNDLAGIYTYNPRSRTNARVKMNMHSGTSSQLTKQEMMEVPVGRLRPILMNFGIQNINHQPPCHPMNRRIC